MVELIESVSFETRIAFASILCSSLGAWWTIELWILHLRDWQSKTRREKERLAAEEWMRTTTKLPRRSNLCTK